MASLLGRQRNQRPLRRIIVNDQKLQRTPIVFLHSFRPAGGAFRTHDRHWSFLAKLTDFIVIQISSCSDVKRLSEKRLRRLGLAQEIELLSTARADLGALATDPPPDHKHGT
ncbi:hypothetical protein SSBR45G_65040 [Bradyrhizobium sp. SSBR45G]|uniref:hypothetical protein n=1 Tax=unclassified Bradyrhizobium TaxID=2631580 RepID=UPI002342B8B0|nr:MULTISPECIES: hypothetical protein [unclassified Bradyrhizobium]GLH81595.1 hypothetical protein SSBR45G_65040 [Bradyrhizobium sp. SSBR45G]GLH88222.1 hypothetical protein SSBR45R_56830 [Bradyrhizobium sp. SSBR45R]